jgi:hypothetical protein
LVSELQAWLLSQAIDDRSSVLHHLVIGIDYLNMFKMICSLRFEARKKSMYVYQAKKKMASVASPDSHVLREVMKERNWPG